VFNHVFESVNDRPLAAIFQSLNFYEGRGYIIDSNGRIEIMDQKDLTSLGTINGDLTIPRYFVGSGSYGYVTDWGPYDDNWGNPYSKILVLDLESRQLSETIDTPSRPEGIVVVDDLIYVANSGSNQITIYDPTNNSLIDSIEVNNGPTQFALDKNQDLWVLSTGAFITGGALQQINLTSLVIIQTVDISATVPNGKLTINGDRDMLFFMGEVWAPDFSFTENKVFKASITQPENYSEIISGKNLYGLGVDPENDEVYVGDAVGFQGNGKVYVFDFSGQKQDEFTVGRGPNGFVFVSGID
jgi:YVTN family beta-propeller protein